MTTPTTKTNSRQIKAILLDEKLVRYPIKFSEAEGWVEMEVPIQQSEKILNIKAGELLSQEEKDMTVFDWEVIRKEGTVKIIYADTVESTKA
jgi:hypothetical protein